MSTKHPLRGVTCPRTPAEWAAATRATLHHAGDLHSAASDLISFAHAGGTAAGVSLAGGEIHALHGLDDAELLSADGEWLVSWSSQDGYWTGWLYERPAVRVVIDMTHDMWVAGLPDHPAIVRQQLTTWRTAARRIADDLLVNLYIAEDPGLDDAPYEVPGVGRTDALTNDGDPTLAGRIWQEAHDASGVDLSSSWLVADLAWSEGFDGWTLTVRRFRPYLNPEDLEIVAADSRPQPDLSVLVDTLRERGYGTLGRWHETDGCGDFGILVVRP